MCALHSVDDQETMYLYYNLHSKLLSRHKNLEIPNVGSYEVEKQEILHEMFLAYFYRLAAPIDFVLSKVKSK